MDKRKVNFLARIALLSVAIIWGSTLVVAKSTTGTISPILLIACRFLIAFVVLGAVFFKQFAKLDKGYWIGGTVIGFCLFLAHSAQTVGVTDAEGLPGRSGFLSAAYCVIVPFLNWAVSKERPDRYNLMAAALCIAGIGFVSFGNETSADLAQNGLVGFTLPDFLALLSGVFFAAHIVTVDKFSRGKDPILMTVMQFLFAGLFSLLTVLFREPSAFASAQWDVAFWAVIYLAVICTALALLLQNVGQRYTSPSSAAIILGTESIFCIIFGVIYADETVKGWLWVGFALIFLAIIVSETKLSFLHRKRQTSRGEDRLKI